MTRAFESAKSSAYNGAGHTMCACVEFGRSILAIPIATIAVCVLFTNNAVKLEPGAVPMKLLMDQVWRDK